MEVYRIHNRAYAPLDGTGAARRGARWNPSGHAIVYAAAAFEGALLEQLVHAGIGRLPRNRVVSRILIPEGLRIDSAGDLDDEIREDERRTRILGAGWLEGRTSVALVVPSAVARPFGRNVLLNPGHEDFAEVQVLETIALSWDPRLLGGR